MHPRVDSLAPLRLACRLAVALAAMAAGPRVAAVDYGLNPAPIEGVFNTGTDLFSGTLTIATGGSVSLASDFTLAQTFAFTGTSSYLTHTGSVKTLTITSLGAVTRSGTGTTWVHTPIVNLGSVSVSGGTLAMQSGTSFNNGITGTTAVSGTGSVLQIYALTNSGTLSASNNGVLQLYGTYATPNLGTINLATGGAVELHGALNNATHTLSAPNGGTFTLKGTIAGGTVNAAAFTSSNGTLDAATVTGNHTLGTNSLTLKNGAMFADTLTVGTAGQHSGTLTFGSNASTLGTTQLAFTGLSSYLSYTGSRPTLTLVPNSSLIRSGTGATYVHTNVTNQGSVAITGGTLAMQSGTAFQNANGATATVSGSGSVFHIYDLANSGTMAASNSGVLQFYGTYTTPNLGTINLATGGAVELHGTLNNSTHTLSAPNGGTFTLKGTIAGGTVNAAAFTSSNGTLDAATVTGNHTLGTNSLTLKNGAMFADTLTVGTAGQHSGTLTFGSNASTLGTTQLAFTGLSSYLSYTGSRPTLTLVSNSSLIRSGTGATYVHTNVTNQGSVAITGGTLAMQSGAAFQNANGATATVSGSGSVFQIYDLVNSGALAASNNGVLQFYGTYATPNLGTISLATGGAVELHGTLNNATHTLSAPNGGTFTLKGTIAGGTVNAAAFTSSNGTLDAATVTGNHTLGTNSLTLKNGAMFADTLTVGVTGQHSGTLTFGSNASTLGTTQLAFTGLSSYLSYTGSRPTLTLVSNSSLTRSGTGATYVHTNVTNQGSVAVTGGTLAMQSGSTLTNAGGTATVSGAGSVLQLYGLANTGTITAENGGQIQLLGTTTTANLGTFAIATGGHVYLHGTLANTAATLNAPTGGAFELQGGTIQGGAVAVDAVAFTNHGGTLDGVALGGNLTLPANSYVTLKNGTTFAGSIAQLGASSTVYWQQAGTLLAKALSFGTSALFYITGENNSLTLDAATTATGQIQIYTNGAAGTAIANEGTITHTTGSGQLHAQTFTNTGTIAANGGTLYLGTTSPGSVFLNQSTGVVRLNGGNVSLEAPNTEQIVNQGTIDLQLGTLYTNGHLTNGSSGFIRGTGAVQGAIVIAGGTLAPGNSGIGELKLSHGTFTVTQPTTFAVELGGTSADRIVFQNPGAINLGTGLLALSLTLLAEPVANTTYTLMQISSGGTGIAGTFASLPISGSLLSANFGGNTFDFTIQYQPNLIAITLVPEPSTYVMIAAGAGFIALLYRRRRL